METGASRGLCAPLDLQDRSRRGTPRAGVTHCLLPGAAEPQLQEEQEGDAGAAVEREKPENNLQLPADGNRYDLADKHR